MTVYWKHKYWVELLQISSQWLWHLAHLAGNSGFKFAFTPSLFLSPNLFQRINPILLPYDPAHLSSEFTDDHVKVR